MEGLQAKDVLDHSAALTDIEKAIVEYWADGPGVSTQPPGLGSLLPLLAFKAASITAQTNAFL